MSVLYGTVRNKLAATVLLPFTVAGTSTTRAARIAVHVTTNASSVCYYRWDTTVPELYEEFATYFDLVVVLVARARAWTIRRAPRRRIVLRRARDMTSNHSHPVLPKR